MRPLSLQLLLLERALVDEHQYREGKASLERELKTLLARHQKSLDPNDQVTRQPRQQSASAGFPKQANIAGKST